MDKHLAQIPALPDFDHCLVNLANSILMHFGAETSAPTLAMADRYLERDPQNVVVLLLDAMGISILERHLAPDGFFRSHLAGNYSSVFPPTTVAATTSIDSGLFPCEHGWLGWDCYYPKLDKNVTVFLNRESLEEEDLPPVPFPEEGVPDMPPLKEAKPAAEFHAAGTFCGYKSVVTKINEAGGHAYYSSPFMAPNPQDLTAILQRITELCQTPEKKYIYAYWNEPDSTMHLHGVTGPDAHNIVNALEKQVQEFAEGLPENTLLFITADHGHIDGKNFCVKDYPEFVKCLKRLPSIEPRALNFFVKDEYKDRFPEIFRETFGENYWLLPKEEVIERKVFGPGQEHAEFRGMLGDYLAISTDADSIFATHIEAFKMLGGHAGITKEEWEIPLIAFEK